MKLSSHCFETLLFEELVSRLSFIIIRVVILLAKILLSEGMTTGSTIFTQDTNDIRAITTTIRTMLNFLNFFIWALRFSGSEYTAHFIPRISKNHYYIFDFHSTRSYYHFSNKM